MKKGVGCRIGGVAVRKLTVAMTPQGPTIDVVYMLVDPEKRDVLGASRKTRDWPPEVLKKVSELVEMLEASGAQSIFIDTDSGDEQSICSYLDGEESDF